MKPHLIKRFAADSSNIKSIGYDQGTLVLEFSSGHLYAYPMSQDDFEAFARAESKGRHYSTHIRGKFEGTKLTGACPKCGSTPEIIGETCSSCGTATAVPVVSKREAKRYGE